MKDREVELPPAAATFAGNIEQTSTRLIVHIQEFLANLGVGRASFFKPNRLQENPVDAARRGIHISYINQNAAATLNGPASCREMVRRVLLERIGDGMLAPGARIVEARLAEEFGVSAIPVREAIRELVSMGVLAAANNKGAWVREVGMGETADALEVKATLESQAARAGRESWAGDGAELRRMRAAIARAAKRRDFATYQRLNHKFHRAIVAAAGNATLLRLWDGLAFEVRTRPIFQFLRAEDPAQTAREHEDIAEALIGGRRPRAAALLAAHAGRLVAHLRRRMAAEDTASGTKQRASRRAA